jgi:hypothetical protein
LLTKRQQGKILSGPRSPLGPSTLDKTPSRPPRATSAKVSPPPCPALSSTLLVKPCLHPRLSKLGVGLYVLIFNMTLVFCMAMGEADGRRVKVFDGHSKSVG